MSSLISNGPVAVLGTSAFVQVSGTLKPLNNAENGVPALPSSFPAALGGELAWSGADFVSDSTFVYELTSADKDEITAGLAHFKGKWLSHDIAGARIRALD